MKRFADFLLEASEGDARKYMKAAIEKMPNVLAELQDEYGDEWVVKCFNKLRNDFVHSGCDVLFVPGIARIAYGELDYDSDDEDTAKVMMLRNIVKFITIAHKEEFSRNLEHISIVKEGPKKGSKVKSEPMTFGELDTMFSRNIEATTASAREEFERDSSANQTKYKVIWLKDFETAHSYLPYVEYDPWCYFEDDYTFERYCKNGNKLYLALAPGFEKLKPGDAGYGRSMIGFDMGPQDKNGHSTMEVCNNRYNHGEDLEHENDKTGDAKYNEIELSKILGVPVWKAYPGYSAEEVFTNTGTMTKDLREQFVLSLSEEQIRACMTKPGRSFKVPETNLSVVTMPQVYFCEMLNLKQAERVPGGLYVNFIVNDNLKILSVIDSNVPVITVGENILDNITFTKNFVSIHVPKNDDALGDDNYVEVIFNGKFLSEQLPAGYSIKTVRTTSFSKSPLVEINAGSKIYTLVYDKFNGRFKYSLADKILQYSESVNCLTIVYENENGEKVYEYLPIDKSAEKRQLFTDILSNDNFDKQKNVIKIVNSNYENIKLYDNRVDGFPSMFIATGPKDAKMHKLYETYSLHDVLDANGQILFSRQRFLPRFLSNNCIAISNDIASFVPMEDGDYASKVEYDDSCSFKIIDLSQPDKALAIVDNVDTSPLDEYAGLDSRRLFQVVMRSYSDEINVFNTTAKRMMFEPNTLFAPVRYDKWHKGIECFYGTNGKANEHHVYLKITETGIDVVDLDSDEVLASIKTTLPVAESFAKYLRDHLDEAKILPTLAAAAAIATGAANANTHVPMHRMPDVKHGNETIYVHDVKDKPSVHGIPTSNYKLTADQYNIMADKDSSAYDATNDEVEEIYEKIKSTPKEKLSKKATDEDLKKIAYYTYKYAELYNVDVDMMLAVMSVESNFNKNANSEAGAQGLAQVMPDTQTDTFNRVLRNKKITLADINPYDIETGIRMCAAIIADLTSRIKTRDIQLIFAAYNKGWNAATAYREYRNNRPYNAADLPTETKNYVKKCMYMYKYYKASEFPKVAEELYYTPEENTEE